MKDRQYNDQKKKDRQSNLKKNDKVITIKDVGILISVMYK
jgi:preprotein translocase subunit YajC